MNWIKKMFGKMQNTFDETKSYVYWDGRWRRCEEQYHPELVKFKTTEEFNQYCRWNCCDIRSDGSIYITSTMGFESSIAWNLGDVRPFGDVKEPTVALCKYIMDSNNQYHISSGEVTFYIGDAPLSKVKFSPKYGITVDNESVFNVTEERVLNASLCFRRDKDKETSKIRVREDLMKVLGVEK